MQYEPVEPTSTRNARLAMAKGKREEVAVLVVAIGLHSDDLSAAIELLIDATMSDDAIIRGNAILSFGHLARRFGRLPKTVLPIIQKGLSDQSDYVRDQARTAVDDVSFFLHWNFDGID